MINVFQIAPHDASLAYLSELFGTMNGLLPDSTVTSFLSFTTGSMTRPTSGAQSYTAATTVLSSMFTTFNTAVLAVGALIVVYMTVVGVLQTAHEGDFMGKKWNNIWIPIRTVIGIAALVPTGSGYSAIQLIMMWIIIQGIGAADMVWATAVKYRAETGSVYKQAVGVPSSAATITMNQLFTAIVCDETSRLTYKNPAGKGVKKGAYYCGRNNPSWCKQDNPAINFNRTQTAYVMGPQGLCGTLNYCNEAKACQDPNGLNCKSCQAQLNALAAIIPTFRQAAHAFAQADYTYRDFYYNSYDGEKNDSWAEIYRYCSDKGIPESECCVPANDKSSCKGNAENFPDANNTGSGDEDYDFRSPSDEAVTGIYGPYMLSNLSVTLSGDCDGSDPVSVGACYYIELINKEVSAYMATAISADAYNLEGTSGFIPGLSLRDIFSLAQEYGWITGGLFYHMLATFGGNQMQDSIPTFSMDTPDKYKGDLKKSRLNVDAVDALLDALNGVTTTSAGGVVTIDKQPSSSFGSSLPKPFRKVFKVLQSAFKDSYKQFLKTMLNTANGASFDLLTVMGGPISLLQIFGTALIIIVELTYVGIMITLWALGILSGINGFVLGTGGISPAFAAYTGVTMVVMPLIYLALGAIYVVGGTFAVYLPLVPYTIFTFGIIGWFFAVIETMVAAPLVALGILSPSGQHELMGKAEGAILMVFNVFLRPTLMLFGLMAAMLLVVVVMQLIIMTFGFAAFTGMKGLYVVDPTVFILTLVAFTALVTISMNKCFQMVYLLPQQVLYWLGAHNMPGGTHGEQELGQMKGSVQGASQKMTDTAQKTAQGAGEAGKAMGEAAGKDLSQASGAGGANIGGGGGGDAVGGAAKKGITGM